MVSKAHEPVDMRAIYDGDDPRFALQLEQWERARPVRRSWAPWELLRWVGALVAHSSSRPRSELEWADKVAW